jgi:hypothetical protein
MKDLTVSTNGLLKRFIALGIMKFSNLWCFIIFLIPVVLLVINGLKWINISVESIGTVFMTSQMLIQYIQNQKSQIVNFYFERDNNELETAKNKPCDENKV